MANDHLCYPTREKFIKLADKYNLIPVSRELIADLETPLSVYAKVFQRGYTCLLESIEGNKKIARYSFLAGDPFLVLKVYGDEIEMTGSGINERKKADLVKVLRDIFSKYRVANQNEFSRFSGGAVGYIGYDYVRQLEKLPKPPGDDLKNPDAIMIFPESVIVFDHYQSKIKVIVNARVDQDPSDVYQGAEEKIELLCKAISEKVLQLKELKITDQNSDRQLAIKSSLTKSEFFAGVEKIKKYIHAGDVLQTVLSQRFAVETQVNPFQVYRALRSINPSPYMYYLDFDELKIVGASPELLVRAEGKVIENRPIAGTRPRGDSSEADLALERELINDPKERAEHVMLVDLGRNDLGRVAKYGSVEVPVFMTCERYSHVMHLVSEVRGELAEGKDALDAFSSSFPAGTVSGAPKIRAMEIIDEIEPVKRGIYAGAVGYFSFNGNMDTCLVIRTIVFKNGIAYAQAGAGIVADSKPLNEYEETINKAKVLIKALQAAGEG